MGGAETLPLRRPVGTTEIPAMRLLTSDGCFLDGDPETVLRALARRDLPLLDDCRRVAFFRRVAGPLVARRAACDLIAGLEEDGRLVVDRPADSYRRN